jgi:hypothetical protein
MDLSTEKSMLVIKNILRYKLINQANVSKKTGVSTSYIHDIVKYLKQVEIVTKRGQFYYLSDPFKLLQLISFERPFNSLQTHELRLETNNITDSESLLTRILSNYESKYAFTMFSGLRRYFEYHISYPMVHLYIDEESIINQITRGEGPIKIWLIDADYDFILRNRKKIGDYYVCDKEQIIIDLFSSGIGRDAAYKFLKVTENDRERNYS